MSPWHREIYREELSINIIELGEKTQFTIIKMLKCMAETHRKQNSISIRENKSKWWDIVSH